MQERCIDTVFQPSHFAVSLLENPPHTRTSPSIAWTRRIVHLFWQFLLEAVRFQDSPKNAPSSQVGAASAMEYICMQECKEMWTLTHIQALSPFLIASISRPVKIKLPFRYPQPESPGSIRISCASTAAQDQPQEYTAVTNQIEPGQVAAQTAQVKLLVSVEFLQYHHGAFAQEFVPKWVLQLQWNL